MPYSPLASPPGRFWLGPKKDRISFVSSSHCQFKVIGICRWTPRLRPRRQDLWLICFFGKIAPFEQAARSKGEIYGFPARLAQREMEGHGTTDGRLWVATTPPFKIFLFSSHLQRVIAARFPRGATSTPSLFSHLCSVKSMLPRKHLLVIQRPRRHSAICSRPSWIFGVRTFGDEHIACITYVKQLVLGVLWQ